jgi:hypothetical protein
MKKEDRFKEEIHHSVGRAFDKANYLNTETHYKFSNDGNCEASKKALKAILVRNFTKYLDKEVDPVYKKFFEK